jgi:hypothetical protein
MRATIMRIISVSVLPLAVTLSATAQIETPLIIPQKSVLKGNLADLAAFGGVKEFTCDSAGNI